MSPVNYKYKLFSVAMREVHDYARANRFGGGFPTWVSGSGVLEAILINDEALEWRDVNWLLALGYDWSAENVPHRFRRSHDNAVTEGFAAGYPNFHQAVTNEGLVFGTELFKQDTVEWRDVKRSDMLYFDEGDWAARFRATHDYAVRKGFVGGYPNFHQANASAGYVYGTILLPADTAQWVGIPGPPEVENPHG